MENTIKNKINVFGKVGKIITTIIIVLLLVAEGFLLVGTVVVAVLPKDAVTVDVEGSANVRLDTNYFGAVKDVLSIDVNGQKIAFADYKDDNIQTKTEDGSIIMDAQSGVQHYDLHAALRIAIVGVIQLASFVVALYFLKALMKAFKTCDSPFDDNVITKMRYFAIALIPCMAVSMVAGCFAPGSHGLSFDFIKVGFVVIIFLLTAVFRYGAQLQKQYDETV